MDFLKTFFCKINFNGNEDSLTIQPENIIPFDIPISNTCINNSLILPARSQVIRKIQVTDPNKEFVVINQEIQTGVLVANSIIDNKNPYVLILNINKEDTIIEAPKLKTENLEDFEIEEFDRKNIDRNKIVLEKLQKIFSKQFEKILTELCSNYCNIFALETGKISYNNFTSKN